MLIACNVCLALLENGKHLSSKAIKEAIEAIGSYYGQIYVFMDLSSSSIDILKNTVIPIVLDRIHLTVRYSGFIVRIEQKLYIYAHCGYGNRGTTVCSTIL